jgi:hypothetical protein
MITRFVRTTGHVTEQAGVGFRFRPVGAGIKT